MKKEQINVSRREFLISSSKVVGLGAGFSLGLYLPLTGSALAAEHAFSTEVNAWVVIKPDDTVIIRAGRVPPGVR